MQSRRSAILIPVALLVGVAIHGGRERSLAEALALECVGIHAEDLPKNVRVRHVARDGGDLVVYVHHLDWTGKIRCILYRDGSLDDVGTRNRKIEVLWSEPPLPSNP